MPEIVRQKGGNNVFRPAGTAKPGSILAEAVSAADLPGDYIKMALYGRNRVGKTHLAGDFPKPMLVVSFEPAQSGGSMTLKRRQGVQCIHIVNEGQKSFRGVIQNEPATAKTRRLILELAASCPFKTVVFDTLTGFQDLVLVEVCGFSVIPQQLDWGMVTEDQYRHRASKTKEALRPMLDLPCHVVMVCQERDHNPPKDRGTSKLMRGLQHESFFSVDLGGATAKWLQDSCDYVAQLFVDKEVEMVRTSLEVADPKAPGGKRLLESVTEQETGKLVRRLRCMYHPNFAAGFRSPNPEAVPEFIDHPTFAKIQAVIHGEKSPKSARIG